MDQKYTLIRKMNVSLGIQRVVTKVRGSVGAEIHNLTTQERRVLESLVREGLM